MSLITCPECSRSISSEAAKQLWALAVGVEPGGEVDLEGVSEYQRSGATPVCPAGGTYTYHPVGVPPECSLHGVLGETHPPGGANRARMNQPR